MSRFIFKKVGYDLALNSKNIYKHGNILRVSDAKLVRQTFLPYMHSQAKYYGRTIGLDWGIPVGFGASMYYAEDIADWWVNWKISGDM